MTKLSDEQLKVIRDRYKYLYEINASDIPDALPIVKSLLEHIGALNVELKHAIKDMKLNAESGGCHKTCKTHYCVDCYDGDKFKWRGIKD